MRRIILSFFIIFIGQACLFAQLDKNEQEIAALYKAALQDDPIEQTLALQRKSAALQRNTTQLLSPTPLKFDFLSKSNLVFDQTGTLEFETEASLELWRDGEQSAATAQIDSQQEIIESQSMLNKMDLALAVDVLYWNLAEAQAQLALSREKLSLHKKRYELAEGFSAAGIFSKQEKNEVEAELLDAEMSTIIAEDSVVEARNALQARIGGLLDSTVQFLLEKPDIRKLQPEAWAERATEIVQHPTLLAINARYKASKAEQVLLKTQASDRPSLIVGYSFDPGFLSGSYTHAVRAGVSLSLANDAAQKVFHEKELILDIEANLAAKKEKLKITTDISTKTQTVRVRIKALQLSEQKLASRENSVSRARSLHQVGELEYLALADFELKTIDARSDVLSATASYYRAVSYLQFALGRIPL